MPSPAELTIIALVVIVIIVMIWMRKPQEIQPEQQNLEPEQQNTEPVECGYTITPLGEFIDNARNKQYRRGQQIYLLVEEIDSRYRNQRDLFMPLAWKSRLSAINERIEPSEHCPALMQVKILRDNED